MRKLLVTAVSLLLAGSAGFATVAGAAPQASSTTSFTCSKFQDPNVELVWSHVCHF